MANEDKNIEFIKTTSDKLGGVQESYPTSFIHTRDITVGGDIDNQLYIGVDRITDNLNIGDENPNNPTRKVGGLQESTIGELKRKSISEIILDIVRPDIIIPTVASYPAIELGYGGLRLMEVGTQLPTLNNFATAYSPGLWSSGQYYAGRNYDSTITMSPNSFGTSSIEGIYVVSVSGTLEPGDIPIDNFGNKYPEKQYKGGTISGTQIKITSVYPIYINDGFVITHLVKHLVDYIGGTTLDVIIPEETETPGVIMKFEVRVPSVFGRFEVKQYNPITDKYDIPVPMVFVDGNIKKYVREDNTYTNTRPTKYKINLKK